MCCLSFFLPLHSHRPCSGLASHNDMDFPKHSTHHICLTLDTRFLQPRIVLPSLLLLENSDFISQPFPTHPCHHEPKVHLEPLTYTSLTTFITCAFLLFPPLQGCDHRIDQTTKEKGEGVYLEHVGDETSYKLLKKNKIRLLNSHTGSSKTMGKSL